MKLWLTVISIGLVLLPFSSPGADREIVIVKSSDNDYFSQTIETFIDHLEPAAHIRLVMAQELDARIAQVSPESVFVSLGLPAIQVVERLADQHMLFNAYLTHEEYLQLGKTNQISVVLDQPLNRYLAFSRLLLDADSIGVIATEPLQFDTADRGLLNRIGLSLNQYLLDDDNKLLPLLRRLLRQNDALLMLPRAAIYNRDTLKGILLTSYRHRKPVVSYSPAHVKAGALASIYSSPQDIGRHLASLVNRHMQHGDELGVTFEYARYYSIVTNPRVARALDLVLPTESELRAGLELIEP